MRPDLVQIRTQLVQLANMAQKAVQAVVSNVAAFTPGIVVRIGSRGASKYLYSYVLVCIWILY